MSSREASYQADATIWGKNKTSYLREIIEEKGGWGLSHTRVPTESRPGHVAVIGGFYEDVSAVTRGWQDNPVEFDHVFNQSRRTWLWGSPDITRMFAKRHPHVTDWFYSPEDEDFAAKDLTILDTWVFDKVTEMFQDAKKNNTLRDELGQEQVFFFLHLLGLDSNGHAHRPHAPEYYLNMAHVDKGVKAMVKLFEDYYGDDATAFVFTADHGMSNQGAHGDGDPTNTRTPIIVWGAGINGPMPGVDEDPRSGINTGFSAAEEKRFTKMWGLDHLKRRDVEQADIAPLLATLLGIPVPVHSVGKLPMEFLKPTRYSAESVLRNARQLFVQVKHKQDNRRQRQVFLTPFAPLEDVQTMLGEAEKMLLEDKYKEVERICMECMEISLNGMRYFQVYDRPYLMTIIVWGYVTWIFFLLAHVTVRPEVLEHEEWNTLAWVYVMFWLFIISYQVLEDSSVMYYAYVAFPLYFGTVLLRKTAVQRAWKEKWATSTAKDVSYILVYVAGTQLVVVAYSYRSVFFVVFLGLALWPFLADSLRNKTTIEFPSHTGEIKKVPGYVIRLSWAFVCILLGSFTLVPLDMNDDEILMFAGATGLILVLSVIFAADKIGFTFPRITQLTVVALSIFLTITTDRSLRAKMGLPSSNQLLTWAAFVLSPPFCRFSAETPLKRFVSVFAALGSPYILLSVNYEVCFYTCLGITMLLWLIIERAIHFSERGSGKSVGATMSDVRHAFMFLLFTHIAFFGTGNVASISSFQISSSFRFLTIFSPFIMGALLILKILIPYTLVTCVAYIITAERGDDKHRLFFLVLCLSDLLAMNMFFWVQDEGSWKEIGNSISHFGFVNCQLVFIPLLFLIASLFLVGVDCKLVSAKSS
uniref:GPI ethanolamine phosphate transferase 1 n=1 Tax=Mucochytrium quahogii TaxID=96639 RepID=A0A7S2S3Q6_9STRA